MTAVTHTDPHQQLSPDCEFCRLAECTACGAYGLVHQYEAYFGGHGYRTVRTCHHQVACDARQLATGRRS